jgi:hypothetical protein
MGMDKQKGIEWQIVVGAAACGSGLLLFLAAQVIRSMDAPTYITFCFAGIVTCAVGATLFFLPSGDSDREMEVDGVHLGSLWLNGRLLVAYETQAPGGRKQFRLTSPVPLRPAREAALIRYLVVEGFVSRLWPQLSESIEEEASWAFFV